MSRQGSSQSSAVLTSPALASPSHTSPFRSSFHGAANHASCPGKPGISHFPTYSMAHPSNEPSLLSPSQLRQPSEPHIRTWSPQIYFASQQGSRVASPKVNGHMQTFGQATPSASPIGISNIGQVSDQVSTDLLARTREQQAALQVQQLAQQQQQQTHLHQQPVMQQRSLPLVNSQNEERILQPVAHHNQAKMVIPIPRDHRQDPTGLPWKGVDEAEACLSCSMDGNEGQISSKSTQIKETYDGFEAKNTSSNDGRASFQHTRADRSLLDLSLSARGITEPESNHPGRSQSRYPSTASQFDVNATKFEPENSRSSGVFSFLGNKQADKVNESESPSLSTYGVAVRLPNGASQPNKWNVAAPEFMPKVPVTTIPSREFSFSALRPSLRPDAPTFEPRVSKSASSHGLIREQHANQPVKKIFGDINFSEFIKPPKSKAVPITRPSKELESKLETDERIDGQEDETGRITQADGRQKRLRYVESAVHLNVRNFSLSRKNLLRVGKEPLCSLCYLNLPLHSIQLRQ